MGGGYSTTLNGIVTKPDNTIVVAGGYISEATFGNFTFPWPGGTYGIYVEMTQSGAVASASNYGRYGAYSESVDLDILSNGNVVLTGYVGGGGVSIRGQAVPNSVPDGRERDAFVFKFRS